jgi:hypothetical protein
MGVLEMSQVKGRRRRWWILGAVLTVVALAAIPLAGVADHIISNAVGRTTTATNADGTERTVYWRDYPGVAGVDPQEILAGPTPEEGFAAGQAMVAEIKAALSEEFRLDWAPADAQARSNPYHGPTQNYYGGESLLTNVNGPESQSTSVPQAWTDKQRAISLIGEISGRYGFGAPTIDGTQSWPAEDRLRNLGGLTPDSQVIVSGVALGQAGQWLTFRFQDLSKDTGGTFEEKLRPPEGSAWQMNTVALGYGANGLLPAENRKEFEARLGPFRGLTPPESLDS